MRRLGVALHTRTSSRGRHALVSGLVVVGAALAWVVGSASAGPRQTRKPPVSPVVRAGDAPLSPITQLARGATQTKLTGKAAGGQKSGTNDTAAGSGKRAAWTCGLCHVAAGWEVIPKRINFDHDRTGVPLTGAHATAPCVGCHKTQQAGHTKKNVPRRVPRDCASCHKDSHRGEQGTACESCHTTRSWKTPRRFDKHADGRFPLSGVHAVVACSSCHRNQARNQFRGTPSTCDACHRKTALGIFSFDHKPLRMGCNQCHSTFGWAPARFDHAVFWPLQGKHKTIANDCKSCHPVSNYAAASRACASCHIDLVNSGKTHPEHKSLGLTSTCERCHTALGWSALKPTWHDPAFPISNGEHQRYRSSCSSCHPGGVGKGQFDCVNCHDGEHTKKKMDDKHIGEVGGYVFANKACLSCHPDGKE
ncbi:MAG: hypothetical protein KC502_13950 [Myxococcales bacterium]|nr:hypothetical protein [Myxococcales bacterium]